MTRNRDYFYSEDDAEQTIDGFYTEHGFLNVDDFANEDPVFDVSDEYFMFTNIQSGKSGGGAAIPTVEYWEYFFWADYLFTAKFNGVSDSYYSFPICWFVEETVYQHWSNEPTQWVVLAGGTT